MIVHSILVMKVALYIVIRQIRRIPRFIQVPPLHQAPLLDQTRLQVQAACSQTPNFLSVAQQVNLKQIQHQHLDQLQTLRFSTLRLILQKNFLYQASRLSSLFHHSALRLLLVCLSDIAAIKILKW